MTNADLERRLRAWYRADIHEYETAPRQLRTDLATLAQAAASTGRPLIGGWRLPRMNRFAPLALAATAVVVALLIGIGLILRPPSVGPSPVPGQSVAPSQTQRATPVPRAASWTATGSMGIPREGHTATLLPDGKVLVAGGYNGNDPLASAELYDPATGSWSPTGSMVTPRGGHTATLLRTGKVLVAGCAGNAALASAELYDPSSGSWTPTGRMVEPRCLAFTATLLADGRVLVAGGRGDNTGILASAELYDPGGGTWSATGSMGTPRYDHTATLLPDGKVLVTGGVDHDGATCCALTSAERYDPGTGSWTPAPSLFIYSDGATRLLDGRVLVTGGPDMQAELYDPGSGSWTAGGILSMSTTGSVTLLGDGRVLVAGHACGTPDCGTTGDVSSAEVYDPRAGSWTATANMGEPRNDHTATLLPDGTVLVAGGFSDRQSPGSSELASAELYDPGSP